MNCPRTTQGMRWAASASLLAMAVPGQGATYQPLRTAPGPSSAWAFDGDRGRVMAVENVAPYLWEWDGTTWAPRGGVGSGALGSFAAYDPARHVLLAGTGGSEWDGASWVVRGTFAGSPLAFDASRRRVVTPTATGASEWDGVQSHLLTSANGPGARAGAAFAYDPAHQRCVLYGGSPLGALDDCWSWDGTDWTLLGTNCAPGPRGGASLAFDPTTSSLVLHGGGATTTWRLAGSTWTPIPTAQTPGDRTNAQFVFDGQGLLLGGSRTGVPTPSMDLWRLQNGGWTELPGGAPAPRLGSAFAFDPLRQQTVLFGGRTQLSTQQPYYDDTWTFDGTWRRQHPATQLPFGSLGDLAWSAVDQALLLGYGSTSWKWDGINWNAITPAVTPPARDLAGFVSEPLGGVLVFGGMGLGNNTYLGDQWRWDGTTWTQQTPAVRPSPRIPLVGFDPLRNVVVLAGGIDGTSIPQDTWEWNGAAWAQRANPPFVMGFYTDRLVFDPARGRLRREAYAPYEWDGVAWTAVGTPATVQSGESFAADLTRGWLLRMRDDTSGLAVLTSTPALAGTYGTGCAYGPAPGLTTIGAPRAGNAGFAFTVATRAANAPTFVVLGLQQQNQPLGSGCSALVGATTGVTLLVADPSGSATLAFPIPNDLALRGVAFAAQAAVVDPPRSLFAGVTLTAGLWTTIGD